MPHFYATRREGDRVEIAGADARHLAGPLRARVGETIAVVEPAGELLTVRLDVVSPRAVAGTVVASRPHHPEPKLAVTMALALLPAAALEEALARCTELGARRFLLVAAERSVARGGKPERWARICREAAMLAGRLTVPEVDGPVSLAEALGADGALLLDGSARERLRPVATAALTLAVGPEGGWSAAEREAAGDRVRTLGPLNLRAENAAAAALATVLALA